MIDLPDDPATAVAANLRNLALYVPRDGDAAVINEAADLIEAFRQQAAESVVRVQELAADVAALRAALVSIVSSPEGSNDAEVVRIAKTALLQPASGEHRNTALESLTSGLKARGI